MGVHSGTPLVTPVVTMLLTSKLKSSTNAFIIQIKYATIFPPVYRVDIVVKAMWYMISITLRYSEYNWFRMTTLSNYATK